MQTLSPNKPTIVIAAFNEENNIHQTGQTDDFQIVVVCNGCTDNTEEIITNEFPLIFKESLVGASKSLAIRHAESLNIGYPRLYLDADILLPQHHAETLISTAKNHTEAALFVPVSKVDTHASSFIVKTYYQAWYSTPHVKRKGFGSGAYLLNENGRKKFGLWPKLIADDGFLRAIFKPNEIIITKDSTVTVKAPKTISSLLKVKTRSKLGNLQLKQYFTQNHLKASHHQTANSQSNMNLTQKFVYYSINLIALMGAHLNWLIGNTTWHRDNSNR